jgi:hypothetical protein
MSGIRSGREKVAGPLGQFVSGQPASLARNSAQWVEPRLISSNGSASHGKHFIVMSHSGHVTMKWAGGAATLPTLKGGRTNVRKARLLTGKM